MATATVLAGSSRFPARSGRSRMIRLGLFAAAAAGLGIVSYVGLGRLAVESNAAAAAPVVVRPKGGSLLIAGGKTTDAIRAHFVELAGGPKARVVVIPTASNTPESPTVLAAWAPYGLASLTSLHARTREDAEKAGFADRLADATGVWFSGGVQDRLAKRYLGTDVEAQLQGVLKRGGVIGGTSAGAAVMTRVMISGGRGEAKLERGFDLLPNAVVDQHFLKRNRLGRMLGVMKQNPGLLGFGIDEQTALVIDVLGSRARVVGSSYVVACVPDHEAATTRVEFLKPGDEADLSALRNRAPSAVAHTIDFDAF